jgi:hypothetical protein
VLQFDRDGKLFSTAKLPIMQQSSLVHVKFMEVDGKLKVLYFDLEENIAVNEFEQLKKHMPESEYLENNNKALVSATLNEDNTFDKQLVSRMNGLPFNVSFGVSIIEDIQSLRYVLNDSKVRPKDFLQIKDPQYFPNVIYSILESE